MKAIIRTSAVIFALTLSAGSALAGPLSIDAIPGNIAGNWLLAGSSASCSEPTLAIQGKADGLFDFVFAPTVSGPLQLTMGVPAPQVVGAPPTASFEAPEPPSNKPRVMRGLEITMPDENDMTVRFYNPSAKVRAADFKRCSGLKIG